MKGVLEREVSKKWIASHLLSSPEDYAYRIHDCPWGRKNFDAFLMSGSILWAIEFKVDRRKTYKYSISEIEGHQLSALKDFSNGGTRRSKVVVYHAATDTWHEMEVLR